MSEQYSGHEPASQEELRQLKELTAVFAMKNGDYNDDGGRVVDERDGLPVTEGGDAHYTVELSFEDVQRLAPEAIAVLDLARELVISYFPRHYEITNNDDEPQYVHAKAMFHVGKAEEHSLNYEALIISDTADGEVMPDRLGDSKRVGPRRSEITAEEVEEVLRNVVEGMRQADELGLSTISKDEAKALSDIIHAASGER